MQSKRVTGRELLKKYDTTRRMAQQYLAGPRSVMLPADPDGTEFWLEPVVTLIMTRMGSGRSDSVAVFAVPNCIRYDAAELVLARHAVWDSQGDKELCKNEEVHAARVSTGYYPLSHQRRDAVDGILTSIDQAIPSHPFAVEGLALIEHPPGPQLSNEEVSPVNYIQCMLRRVTKFQVVELYWTLRDNTLSGLDNSCRNLADFVISVATGNAARIDVKEKYDIDPIALGKLAEE